MTRTAIAIGIGIAGAIGTAGIVLARRRARQVRRDDEANRWRIVTVRTERRDFVEPPPPLDELGDRIDWRTTPAPGGRGLELAARLREKEPSGAVSLIARASGADPRQELRMALRDAKSLLETGEVIRKDPQPEGRRNPTPQGALLDLTARHARGEGVL